MLYPQKLTIVPDTCNNLIDLISWFLPGCTRQLIYMNCQSHDRIAYLQCQCTFRHAMRSGHWHLCARINFLLSLHPSGCQYCDDIILGLDWLIFDDVRLLRQFLQERTCSYYCLAVIDPSLLYSEHSGN